MSEPMEEKDLEMNIEKVEVIEDEKEATADEETSWREEFEVAGGELADFLGRILREVNVRRIIVKNKHGRTLLDIPVAVGAIGLLPPLLMWSAIAVGAAVLTNCSVTIERVDKGEGNVPANGNGEKGPEEQVSV